MRILFVSVVSSRRPQDMSSRLLQDTSSRRLRTCLQDVFKTSCKMPSRRLQDVLEDVKSLRWRRVEDVFKTYKCLLGIVFLLISISNEITRLNRMDLTENFNVLSKGTPSLILVTPHITFVLLRISPSIPLSPGEVWLFLSSQNIFVDWLPTLTVPYIGTEHLCLKLYINIVLYL